MNELRVGILGCGKMGRVYAHWFSRNPRARVVSFYNRTFSKAENLAKEYENARAVRTWEDITVDPDVDVVGICSPSHEHLEQLEHAVLAGKHVLCEKPMARDADECRRMCIVSSASPVKVAVGFQMRFHPVIEKVDSLLPQIGDIFHLDFVFGMYRPEVTWRHSRLQGGGVLNELGSHLVDLACHWAGNISAVTAVNRIISSPREVEDYSVNLFEFAGGATGYLSCNYFDRRDRSIHGNILGSTGQINWQFSPYDPADSRVALHIHSHSREVPIDIPVEIDSVYPGHLDSFHKAIGHFVDCVFNGSTPLAGAAEGLRSMEVVDASYRSASEKARIELK